MSATRLLQAVRHRVRQRTDPVGFARSLGVQVGARCRLYAVSAATFGSEPYLVRIGDDVTVTSGVRFVTHDGGVAVLRDEFPDLEVVAPVEIGDRSFLGIGTVVLPGIRVGARSVVGSGSVLTRDVPPGMVVAGVPARPLCTVEEYRERALLRGTHTRGLAASEKRRHFKEMYASGATSRADDLGPPNR